MPDYGKLTVARLKEELDKRGLPKSGLKAALVQRLSEADAETERTDDAPRAVEKEQDVDNTIDPKEDASAKTVIEEAADGLTPRRNGLAIPTPTRTDDKAPDEHMGEAQQDELDTGAANTNTTARLSIDDSDSSQAPTQGFSALSNPSSELLRGNPTQPGESSKLEEQLPTPTNTQSEDNHLSISTQAFVTGEEILEDSRKRKRRSQSPPPSSFETTKRLKADDFSPKVELPEDLEKSSVALDPAIPPNESQTNGSATSVHNSANLIETTGTRPQDALQTKSVDLPLKESPTDTRFKNLFAPPARTSSSPGEDLEDRIVSPALHPATSALYIRDLMRPLNPSTLKSHLAALATPPSSSPDQSSVKQFYLDSIRTHCLVGFSSIPAASRVRSGLHDRIWPSERDRKPLWVDFVPEEKLDKWIDVEQTAKSERGLAAKRWEVIYETEDEEVKAYLQEIGTDSGGARIVQQKASAFEPSKGQSAGGVPSEPRMNNANQSLRQPHRGAGEGKGFQALDDLFKSTAAKPKLYFLPVPKSEVDRRMGLLAAGRGGGRSDESRRFSFEENRLVDKGPEFGRGVRGGFGGRGGGFDRGSQWGRGGRSYRGGGTSDRRGENRSRYG